MKERIAIIDGIRTPFCKAGGAFKEIEADDLGAYAVKELLARTEFPADEIDELIFGNVLQPVHLANIARLVAIKAGLPFKTPAFTVNRNCASGLEAITTAANKLWLGEAKVIIAGGTESMSNFPILFNKKMRNFLQNMSKAKTLMQKLKSLTQLRPSFFKPEIPELSDPLCSLNMGQTAEVLSREFKITREEQDLFALQSQQRAEKAYQAGFFKEEIVPIPLHKNMQVQDEGPRPQTTLDILKNLKPAFERLTGSVTAGNSSQVTDGAAAILLMLESTAKEKGLVPLGYLIDYSYAALDPKRMGLGPCYALAKLITQTNKKLTDLDLIEINEAFAAQVLAVIKACASDSFCQQQLGLSAALGQLEQEKLNVNGGAIALGHPLGSSGVRLVLTLLKELKRRHKNLGAASLCVGGGQGGAVLIEIN